MNPDRIQALFERIDPPLWLVTAQAGRRHGGLLASFVVRVSIVPGLPRVVIALARHHHTAGLVQAAGAFALHLLAADQFDRAWRFGARSGRDIDKLAGLPHSPSPVTGSPLLENTPGWLDCRVEARFDTGDRDLCLAEVVDGGLASGAELLTAGGMLERADAEQRRVLEAQLRRDAGLDAEAIGVWRRRRGPG